MVILLNQNIGIALFFVAIIAFCAAMAIFLAALIVRFVDIDKVKNDKFFLIGLIGLLLILLYAHQGIIFSIIFLVISIVCFISWNNKKNKYTFSLNKIALICLLTAGISLLLTSFLCSWWS